MGVGVDVGRGVGVDVGGGVAAGGSWAGDWVSEHPAAIKATVIARARCSRSRCMILWVRAVPGVTAGGTAELAMDADHGESANVA